MSKALYHGISVPFHPVHVQRFEYSVIGFQQRQRQQSRCFARQEMVGDEARHERRIGEGEVEQYRRAICLRNRIRLSRLPE
jgi:hypothetical protein